MSNTDSNRPVTPHERRAIFVAAFQAYLLSQSEPHAIQEGCAVARKLNVYPIYAAEIARDAVNIVRDGIKSACADMGKAMEFYVNRYLNKFQDSKGRRPGDKGAIMGEELPYLESEEPFFWNFPNGGADDE